MARFRLTTLFATVTVVAIACYFHRPLLSIPAYIHALNLEHSWTAARPKTMKQLESHLSLYTKREVQPSASEWAPNYSLKQEQRMIQYTILGAAEMEVVYDSNDEIVTIITSYE